MAEDLNPVGTATTGGSQSSGQPAPDAAPETIDLEALADKVMRLLREEARLERERLGRRPLS
jgi:hypothetical protein